MDILKTLANAVGTGGSTPSGAGVGGINGAVVFSYTNP